MLASRHFKLKLVKTKFITFPLNQKKKERKKRKKGKKNSDLNMFFKILHHYIAI